MNSKTRSSLRTFWAFVVKEGLHIVRDTRTMLILFVLPIALMLLFGFAICTDVKNVNTVVVTSHTDHLTQRLTEALGASEYFSIIGTVETPAEAEHIIRERKAELAVVFTNHFAANASKYAPQFQLIVDGTNPNMAQMYTAYAQNIMAQTVMDEHMGRHMGGGSIVTKMLYNPQGLSAYNFVPGIMGMLFLLVCAMMTSISIVREKERGTMEILLVSPIRPIMIIIAKAVPYFILALAIMVIILLMSHFVLQVPLAGSLVAIVGVTLLYILLALALGLFISNVAQTQLVALLMSAMLLLLPTVMLSGMLFPIESMPTVLQYITSIVPPRHYISIMRKLMIMGVDFSSVAKETGILLLMTMVLLAAALAKFKNRLE